MESACLRKNYISKLSSHLPNNSVSRLQYREVRDTFGVVYMRVMRLLNLLFRHLPVGLFLFCLVFLNCQSSADDN